MLQAWNEHGVTRQEQIVDVDPPQIDALVADPQAAMAGREVRLQWTARGASRLTLREAPNEKDPGGDERDLDLLASTRRSAAQDTWYIVTAYNAGGQASKRVKVSVARPPPPQAIFRAEPESVTRGEPAQLTWQIDNAVQMTIQPGLGTVPPGKGSALVKPDRETEYTADRDHVGRPPADPDAPGCRCGPARSWSTSSRPPRRRSRRASRRRWPTRSRTPRDHDPRRDRHGDQGGEGARSRRRPRRRPERAGHRSRLRRRRCSAASTSRPRRRWSTS